MFIGHCKTACLVYTVCNCCAMYIKELLKNTCTLQAQFVQEWNSEMDLSKKCTLYKYLKAEFKLKPYLLKLSCDIFFDMLLNLITNWQ